MNAHQLSDWTPITLHWEQGYPMLDWCYLGKRRFLEPFFEDTITRQLQQPFSLLFQPQTDLEVLDELQRVEPGIEPTGFIFHMSRCGSTLLAQLLAALPQNIVIAEAGPIDSVLRANWRDPKISDDRRICWLRALVSAYARPRNQQEQHFFIKFDSWHTVELPLIRRAFPAVPWIFLYRAPIQVMVSHDRQPGAQMVQTFLPPESIGIKQLCVTNGSVTDYRAQVLAHICTAAYNHFDDHGLLVNYAELPAALWSVVASHFQLNFTIDEIATFQRAVLFDAKNPSMYFQADSQNKEWAASTAIQKATERWLLTIYESLEQRRLQFRSKEKNHA